ncbi:hypothetical protein GDO86_013326 [Hymenochirus boettgeri]|uniref:Swi5-dependent recombination DNA repair protein 1 homolog n=1 Tax=Hymenochirus boettgeri TaxID=247094 RepID=A0A8T2IW81_9PIPI|nr:hypothetical protein GDO86_013326 [Hymenochirus boettgeri]
MEATSSNSCSHYNASICSPDDQKNIASKQPMSATLRERLRKTRRSFNSAFSVAKRLKVDCEETESSSDCVNNNITPCEALDPTKLATKTSLLEEVQSSETKPPSEMFSQTTYKDTFHHRNVLQEKRILLKTIQEKEDILRRLKMVKLYRAKNNLSELKALIEKWRKSSQLLLYQLQIALSTENKNVTLTQLIESCGLDEKLLHYSRTEEDFEDL